MNTTELLRVCRNNRTAVFTAVPFAGAALGSILAELLPDGFAQSPFLIILHVALWSAIISAPLTLALFLADLIYRRGRLNNPEIIKTALLAGAIAGAISGAVAQTIYNIDLGSGLFKNIIVRSLCWGIMGAILGWRLSKRVPNLGPLRGCLAGLVGGIIGGLGFIFTSAIFPEFIGRMLGVGILGAALGVAIITIEQMFRTASLLVRWGPKETTTLNLGATPITIGGGDDHVCLRGIQPKAYSVWVEQGKVFCKDHMAGKQVEVKDKGTFTIARVDFQVSVKQL
jgi:uncharacterized membrane protein YeaQ/YmgE (transglycosylase-associated protein family)